MVDVIDTRRLRLRPYEPDDWERVHLYAAIPEFSQYDGWGPNSIEDTKKFVASSIENSAQQPVLRYDLAVALRDHDLLIGGCSLKRARALADDAGLGFAIHPDFQKRGYATEAARALIDFAFDELGIKRVWAECDTRNVASRRVMEKAGMRLVSELRGHRVIRGVMRDSYRFEIARETKRLG